MSVETLEDGDAYTIEYDDDIGGIVHRWDRFVQDETFREGSETMLSAIEDHSVSKLLIDSRELNVVSDEDTEWLFSDLVPRLADAGIRYTVTVYEESTIAKMNMDKIAENAEESNEVGESHMTTDLDDARSWLKSQ